MAGSGVLALWKDCAAGRRQTFEQWYQTEHMTERLAVPGFLRCRRYEAINAASEFFTWYEVETPEVLSSDAYLDRLDNPTPLTSEVMSGIMQNMSRTVCDRTILSGIRFGAIAVAVKLDNKSPEACEALRNMAFDLSTDINLARAELWINAASASDSAVMEEEKLRGGDSSIGICLLLEFLQSAVAEDVAGIANDRFGTAEVETYRLLCEQTGVLY